MENNQSASRAARRFLTERVRDDWDWPGTPTCWSASDEEIRGVREFRERYYGTTSPGESEAEAEAEIEADVDVEASADAGPYKFDSPDSIGDAVERKKQNRKRKRREAQQNEMQWNEGLLCFVERRDNWTGAAAVRKYSTKRTPTGDATDGTKDEAPHEQMVPPNPEESSSANNDPADPLIPLALPLLPDNPIRASINHRTYPDIYNNIVLSSRSPSVPINLADMTRALVQGWKDNGEWPPKAGPLDPLAGRKKSALASVKTENGEFLSHHPHMKKGMDSVKRMFHFNGHNHDTNPAPNG